MAATGDCQSATSPLHAGCDLHPAAARTQRSYDGSRTSMESCKRHGVESLEGGSKSGVRDPAKKGLISTATRRLCFDTCYEALKPLENYMGEIGWWFTLGVGPRRRSSPRRPGALILAVLSQAIAPHSEDQLFIRIPVSQLRRSPSPSPERTKDHTCEISPVSAAAHELKQAGTCVRAASRITFSDPSIQGECMHNGGGCAGGARRKAGGGGAGRGHLGRVSCC